MPFNILAGAMKQTAFRARPVSLVLDGFALNISHSSVIEATLNNQVIVRWQRSGPSVSRFNDCRIPAADPGFVISSETSIHLWNSI
jgi:hypothetical protein